MNKIVVYFTQCTPEPSNGYLIEYRVAGSSDEYTIAGYFFNSPAVFYDTENPPETCYEGLIRTDCGNDVMGNPVLWTSCESGEESLSIALISACSNVPASYLINGATIGDILEVKAVFSGVIQNTGSFTRADLDISSPDGTSDNSSSTCYTDGSTHGFTIEATTTITTTGTTAIVNLTAVCHNSTEDLTNVSVTIISRNGDPENISCIGCKINSATGGTC